MKRFFLLIFFVSVVLAGCSDYDSAVPDTPGNRKGFKNLVDVDPENTIKKIYIYADLFIDPFYCLSFEAPPERVEEIIHKLGLKENKNSSWEDPAGSPPKGTIWWKAEDRKKSKFFSIDKDRYSYDLWYDPSSGKCQLLLFYL